MNRAFSSRSSVGQCWSFDFGSSCVHKSFAENYTITPCLRQGGTLWYQPNRPHCLNPAGNSFWIAAPTSKMLCRDSWRRFQEKATSEHIVGAQNTGPSEKPTEDDKNQLKARRQKAILGIPHIHWSGQHVHATTLHERLGGLETQCGHLDGGAHKRQSCHVGPKPDSLGIHQGVEVSGQWERTCPPALHHWLLRPGRQHSTWGLNNIMFMRGVTGIQATSSVTLHQGTHFLFGD